MVMQAQIFNEPDLAGAPRVSDEQFSLWQLDTSRSAHRTLLVRLTHSSGVIYVASSSYQSAEPPYESYDAWLVGDPVMEDDLDSFRGIGDLQILDQDESRDLMGFFWRGHPCELLFGDDEWRVRDFRSVGAYLISGLRATGPRAYTVDLMDGGRVLDRRFSLPGDGSTSSSKSTIQDILEAIGLPAARFINVDRFARDYRVSVQYQQDTLASSSIRDLADNMGAHLRFGDDGRLEVFIPDTETAPNLTIVDDDIIQGSVSMVESTPAYSRVQIDMSEGGPVAGDTGAPTGPLRETLAVRTLMRRVEDAQDRLSRLVIYYAAPHAVWRLSVLHVAGQIRQGDYIRIEHEDFTGNGLVTHIRRSLLGVFDIIEIRA